MMTAAALDLVARAVAILVVAWLATLLVRRRPAAIGALIWTTALAGLLVMPALAMLAPDWRVPVWRSAPPLAPQMVRQEPSRLATASVGDMTAPIASSDSMPLATGAFAIAGAAQESVSAAPWRPSVVVMASLFSAVVTLLLIARLVVSHRRVTRIARRERDSFTGDAEWLALVHEVAAELGIRRPVAVVHTSAVNVPAVAGVTKPALLLPLDAGDWPAEVRRAVALHELAHVARYDAVGQLVGQIACAVYWFVPLVWHGARRASALRERASDDVVLRAGVRPAAYADSLIRLAADASGVELQSAALAMARPSRLHERVDAILDAGRRRSAITLRSRFAFIALAATAVALASSIVLTAAPAPDAILYSLDNAVFSTPVPRPAPSTPVATAPRRESRSIAELVTPAQSAPQPPVRRLCGGELDNSSRSIINDDNRRRLTMKLSGRGCRVDLTAEGRFEFNADFTDISSIASGGFFKLDVTENGGRRELNIEPRNGALARTWRVDGRDAPYDAAAQAWFAAFLVELDRQTAIGVDIRLPLLLRQGGVDAVLAETALMPSDYARGEYYTRLAKTTKLSANELTRLVRQATQLTESDHYAATLVAALVGKGLDDSGRLAVAELIEKMDSDHYRAESIGTLMGAGRPTSNEMALFVRLIPKMESDHYKTQVLLKVLSAGTLDPAQQAELARLASSVESDHYATEFLKAVVGKGSVSSAVQQAALKSAASISSGHYLADVLTTLITARGSTPIDVDELLRLMPSMDSDHYASTVLTKLVEVPQLNERQLLAIVDASKTVRSDHYKTQVLQGIGRHAAASDRVKQAVLDAAATMSGHYNDQVRRAMGR